MPPRIQSKLLTNSLRPHLQPSSTRPFTNTATPQGQRRDEMHEWFKNDGQELKSHIPGVQNYLTGLRDRRNNRLQAQEAPDDDRPPQPFPLNPAFVSEPILSEELRGEIYRRVVQGNHSVREVSVDLGVDMRRIGAVVRLVELEKRWKKQVCLSFLYLSFPLIDYCMMSNIISISLYDPKGNASIYIHS